MKKNFYTIEKFKQTFDSEGKEILTKINANSTEENIEVNNEINEFIMHHFYSSYSVLELISNTDILKGRIAVTAFKLGAQGHRRNRTLSMWNYNPTSNFDTAQSMVVGGLINNSENAEESGTDVVVQTFKNVFSPPISEARTINSLILSKFIFTNSSDNTVFSTAILDTPCIQETDEVLIITYRYVYDKLAMAQTNQWYDKNPDYCLKMADDIGRLLLIPDGNKHCVYGKVSSVIFNSISAVKENNHILATTSLANTSYDILTDTKLNYRGEFCEVISFNIAINSFVGKVLHSSILNSIVNFDRSINTFSFDSFHFPTSEMLFRRPLDTVVQNSFNKSLNLTDDFSASVTPFFDVNNQASSIGLIQLSEDFTSGDTSYIKKPALAELIRVHVTSAGSASTAEYRVSKRLTAGYQRSSNWDGDKSSIVLTGNYNADFGMSEGVTHLDFSNKTDGFIHTLSQMRLGLIFGLSIGETMTFLRSLSLRHDGIHIHSLNMKDNRFPIKIDSTTLPTFLATDLRGVCAAEDGTIFAACNNTGLWKLTRNLGDMAADMIATRITNTGATDDTSCRAVNFGRYGNRFNSDARMVALFGNELCVSENGGSSWTMYNASSTPAFNPSFGIYNEITGIVIHPQQLEVIITGRQSTTLNVLNVRVVTTSISLNTPHRNFLWNGTTGTITTKNETFLSDPIAEMYGSGNNIFIPLSNGTNEKWCERLIQGTNEQLKVFNNFSSFINLDGSGFKKTCVAFVYDEIADESMMFYGDSDNFIYDLSFNSVNYWKTNTTSANTRFMSFSPNDNAAICFIYRGILIASGSMNSVRGTNLGDNTTTNDEILESYMCLITASFGNNDYYKNNRLNYWYNYGWDGNNWVLDDITSKTASSNTTELIEGLSITFEDDSAAAGSVLNFVENDASDTHVFDGIVKDDFTNFNYSQIAFHAPTVVGNTFTPSIIPANGAGNRKVPISINFSKLNSRGVVNTEDQYTTFSYDYIFSGLNGFRRSFAPVGTGFSRIGEILPKNVDFLYEFKLGIVLNEGPNFNNTNFTDEETIPMLCLTQKGNTTDSIIYASESDVGLPFFGIRPNFKFDDPDAILIHVYYNGLTSVSQMETIVIENYNPKNDVFGFRNSGGIFTFERNGVVIDTPNNRIANNVTSLTNLNVSLIHYATGFISGFLGNYAGNNIGNSIELRDMFITYNDQKLISKIGTPFQAENGGNPEIPATGSFASDFGKVLGIEYTLNASKIMIDGVEAVIIKDYLTTVPLQGQILLCEGTGEITFSPDDAGKTITGDWRYIPRLNQR